MLQQTNMGSRDPEKGGNGGGAAAAYIQERSSTERRWTSWLVPMIVLVDVLLFIIVMFENNCPNTPNPNLSNSGFRDSCVAPFLGRFSFQPLTQNPLLGPSSASLYKMGALQWNSVVNGHQGWRLITSMWLHAGLFHLLINMICLVLIGVRLEQQFGFVKVGILYLISGIGGNILSALFLQKNISVGASGALFGLLGAMLSELLVNWTIYANKASVLFSLIVIIAVNLAVGLMPRIDNFAHIGGFLTGFLLGFSLFVRPHLGWLVRHNAPDNARVRTTKYLAYQQLLVFLTLILLVVGFIVSLVMLFKGKRGNDECSWCHYLDCIPTNRWSCNT